MADGEKRLKRPRPDPSVRTDGTPGRGAGHQPYRYEPFKEGNTAAQSHGAGAASMTWVNNHPTNAVLALSDDILQAAAQWLGDPLPEQMEYPQFRPEVVSWARLQARAELLWRWTEDMSPDEMATPRRAGSVKSPFELWLSAEGAAAKARDRLGLNPKSWAGIRKDLGIARKAEEDSLEQLSARGAQIRRMRAVEGGGQQGA